MNIFRRYIGYFSVATLLLVTGFMIVACQGQQNDDLESMLTSLNSSNTKKPVECVVSSYDFSTDYKFMDLTLKLNKGLGALELSDTASVKMVIRQKAGLTRGILVDDNRPPVLYSIKNVAKEEVAKDSVKMLMLVDLCQPQYLVDLERQAVQEVRTLLDANQLYVAFMQGDKVSETYEATDYIINNYFQSQSVPFIYLYRSLLEKLTEMADPNSVFARGKHKGLIVLSNGKTYNDDRPLDPRHFEIQQRLAELAPQLKGQEIWVSFAQFSDNAGTARNANDALQSATASNQQELGIMQLLCTQTLGVFQNSFDWPTLRDDFMKEHEIDYDDYRITLMMPDHKVFRGNRMSLDLDFFNKQTGEQITTCHHDYAIGSVYHPIIVRGKRLNEVLLEGLLVAVLLSLAIYLTLQVVAPWVRYQHFLRKHVIRYTGAQMSKDGILLDESCYLCKAPFEVGDEVVTKCEHVMHKECWDENDYHCPEYGRNCEHGSHYYNQHNLLDVRNATFYMQWIMAGVLAGFLAWTFFMLRMHLIDTQIITYILFSFYGITPDTPEAEKFLLDYSAHLDFQPAFGFSISFFSTLILSYLALRNVKFQKRNTSSFLRAIIAGLCGFLFFAFSCVVAILLDVKTNSIILDSVPWILMTTVIMYCVTLRTRIRVRPLWLLIACLLDIFLMYAWLLFYQDSLVDFRLFLLLSFLFTAVVLAICIGFEAPQSEHYFLQTSGAIKPLDIALYKWMRANPSAVVTLGQSVDCSIHLSWDISGNVAPIHAELYLRRGTIWLKALEKGVLFNNEPMEDGETEPLSHGNSFTIGNTTFTYLEKDF